MSLFESFPVQKGIPVFLREHLVRLAQSCTQCGFTVEKPVLDSVESLLRESAQDGFARIYVTAGDGIVSEPADRCRVLVFVESRAPVAPEAYARGYDLVVAQGKHRPLFGGLKTANYWANLDALSRVRPNDEALLFNESGELISACMANVFMVQNGVIKTPSSACGAREGIVREWVMQQRKVDECVITPSDLAMADEVFLTNSWIGVMPARRLEGCILSANTVALALRREYETGRDAVPGVSV
jgi:branched-subunit amino acid aminotransferase/4-amino-4-deoxychorismate lyase